MLLNNRKQNSQNFVLIFQSTISLPNMELNINEVRKYIRGKNNPEEIMNFDLVEKIINEQDDIKIKFTKNAIVLSIGSIVKNIGADDVEFINISTQNKNPKVFN